MNTNLKKEIKYLYIVQALNVVFPLFIMGYVANLMGVESFGRMAFYILLTTIFIFFIDFGFNLVGARHINLYKDEKVKIKSLYSNVQIIKLLIYLIILLISFLSISLNDFYNSFYVDAEILKLAAIFSISTIFSSSWVFNGFGINSKNALILFIFKFISLILIILFVKSKDDLIVCVFIQGFVSVISGFYSTIFLIKNGMVSFGFSHFSFSYSHSLLIESGHNFIASLTTFLFTYGNPIFIKLYFGDYYLGIYFAAEKVVSFLKVIFNPLILSYYSVMCTLYNNGNHDQIIINARKIYLIFISLIFLALFLNFFLGDYVYFLVFGEGFELVSTVSLMVLACIPVSLAMVLVNLIIVPIGKSMILKKYYLYGVMLHISYFYFFVDYFGFNGVLISALITESCITFLFILFLKNHWKTLK